MVERVGGFTDHLDGVEALLDRTGAPVLPFFADDLVGCRQTHLAPSRLAHADQYGSRPAGVQRRGRARS